MNELALWRAVIAQAFSDATYRERSGCEPDQVILAGRFPARRWLLNDSEDFRAVCAYADLEPSQVRALAVKCAGRGWRSYTRNQLAA